LSWRPFRSVNVVNERQMRELLARWPDSTHHWSAIAGLRAPATAAMLGDPIAAVLICELPGSYVVRHCAGHVADVVRSIALVTPTHQPTAYTPTAPDSADHVGIAHWLKTLPTGDGCPSSGGAGVAGRGTSESIPRWLVGGQTLPESAAIVGVRPQSGLPSKHPPNRRCP
jgi:hypothetical protein